MWTSKKPLEISNSVFALFFPRETERCVHSITPRHLINTRLSLIAGSRDAPEFDRRPGGGGAMVLLAEGEYAVAEENQNPNKSVNKRKREDFVAVWRGLTASDIEKLNTLKRRFYYIQDEILYLLCPICEMLREATTDNFVASHVSRYNGIDGWFSHFPHWFENGASRGCNRCFAQKLSVQNNDTDGDGYIRHIMCSYPELFEFLTDEEQAAYSSAYKERTGRTLSRVPQTDSGARWYTAQLGKECWATGFAMLSKPEKGHPLNPSPNGLDIQERGTYSRKRGHAPDRTVAVCRFANIRQGATQIPNLREAYTTLYETMVADWWKTPEQRMKEEDEALQTTEKPFPPGIHNVASVSLKNDNKKGRDCDLRTSADVVVRLKAVRMRCHTTGVLMSAKSGWNKVHADRIDNAFGHVDGNLEWKCALFMGKDRLTRDQFLRGFLQQKRVAVPEAMARHIAARITPPKGWVRETDQTSGLSYYLDKRTKQCTWSNPALL